MAIATGQQTVPTELRDGWQFRPEALDRLSPAIRRVQLENSVLPIFGEKFNPLLRCIVRRTRGYLESTINPATGSYYLLRVIKRTMSRWNKCGPRHRKRPPLKKTFQQAVVMNN